ncbi:hypothetical protein D1872_317060 [compost metagenome]
MFEYGARHRQRDDTHQLAEYADLHGEVEPPGIFAILFVERDDQTDRDEWQKKGKDRIKSDTAHAQIGEEIE